MGQTGILTTISVPEYSQLMLIVPSPGMPVIVNWLTPFPVVGIVTLVAVMANGVAANAGAPENP